MAQAFLVDAVADAGRDVPFGRHVERGEPLRGLKQRLHRNEVVLSPWTSSTGGAL